jgi:hypothetical protein
MRDRVREKKAAWFRQVLPAERFVEFIGMRERRILGLLLVALDLKIHVHCQLQPRNLLGETWQPE